MHLTAADRALVAGVAAKYDQRDGAFVVDVGELNVAAGQLTKREVRGRFAHCG
ncbi:MAG: hypothetical protein O3A53_19175 [Acidobacteria bacterium]|nr:hypothetical protein [Acidobacteriota bacterium]MDA1236904.1 hypothetical protein [Acidobacteriota bacterium]